MREFSFWGKHFFNHFEMIIELFAMKLWIHSSFFILAPEGCFVSVHKNSLPYRSYQLSFSKRPWGDFGRPKTACTLCITHFVMISTYLLFNISHKIACVHLQLLLVHPHVTVFWLENKMYSLMAKNPIHHHYRHFLYIVVVFWYIPNKHAKRE